MRQARSLYLVLLLTVPAALAAEEAMAPEVTVSAVDCYEYDPQVAYNSNRDEYLVVWFVVCPAASPVRRVHARRLDAYGRPLAGTFDIRPDGDTHDRGWPAVAYDRDHDRYLVAYLYDYWGDGSDWDIRARHLAWDGVDPAWTELTIAATAANEREPAVAYSHVSAKYLVSWHQEGVGTWHLLRGALFAFGAAPSVFSLTIEDNRLSPDISYDPFADRFAVSSDTPIHIYATLVDPDVAAFGAEIPVSIAPETELTAAVASCENWQHLVTWQWRHPAGDYDLLARFLYGSGALDGDPITIAASTGDETFGDVACLPSAVDYLIVWEQEELGEVVGIGGRRLRATKSPRPAFEVRGPTAMRPAVAGGRAGWLVVWEQPRPGSSWIDIHARVVWELFADGFEWGSTDCWSSTTL